MVHAQGGKGVGTMGSMSAVDEATGRKFHLEDLDEPGP